MQPQGQVQIVSALAAGEAPQDALDRPRWRWLDQGSVVVEAGFDPARRRALADRGHAGLQTRAAHHFGGAQLVIRDGSHLVGATDRRKDGEVCSG